MSMYPIASIASGSGIVTPTFTSIPQTFTHLQLRMSLRDTSGAAATNAFLRFNGDGAANYWQFRMSGDGATASGTGNTSYGGYMPIGIVPGSTTANVYGIVIVDILDYTNTSKTKAVKSSTGFDANGSGYVGFGGGFWNSTAAINSLQCGADTVGNALYTRIDLYGITTSSATGV